MKVKSFLSLIWLYGKLKERKKCKNKGNQFSNIYDPLSIFSLLMDRTQHNQSWVSHVSHCGRKQKITLFYPSIYNLSILCLLNGCLGIIIVKFFMQDKFLSSKKTFLFLMLERIETDDTYVSLIGKVYTYKLTYMKIRLKKLWIDFYFCNYMEPQYLLPCKVHLSHAKMHLMFINIGVQDVVSLIIILGNNLQSPLAPSLTRGYNIWMIC